MRRYRSVVVWLIILISLLMAVLASPIPQDPAYHQFAGDHDDAGWLNWKNISSNLFYLLAGFAGIYSVLRHTRKQQIATVLDRFYLVFFTGIILTGLGSGWYHFAPNNNTLAWDRLAMTIAFMSLFSVILHERVSSKLATQFFYPLIMIGIASVVYWIYGESMGRGDLRLYMLVQFVPVLLMPFILILYKEEDQTNYYYWLLFAGYMLAKLAEHFDTGIFHLTMEMVSGHTLKHLISACAAMFLIKHYRVKKYKSVMAYS